jgi:biotin carboxyl carrier protein
VRLLANAGGATHVVEIDDGNGTGLVRVKVDAREYLLDIISPGPGVYSLVLRGKVFNAFAWSRRGRCEVQIGNLSLSVEVASAQSQRPSVQTVAAVAGRHEITAPMSGRVIQVLVQPGQTVQDGEPLVIIEAMKMETEIRAIAHGQVKDIQVDADMAVEAGQLLLIIEGR